MIWTVYRLVEASETRYIGITTRPLSVRLKGHLSHPGNRALACWLVSLPVPPRIEALEQVTGTRKQAERRERETIYQYLASGARLLNIAHIKGDITTLQAYLQEASASARPPPRQYQPVAIYRLLRAPA